MRIIGIYVELKSNLTLCGVSFGNLTIVSLMRLYTRDGRVLAMAQMIEDILKEAPVGTHEGFEERESRLGRLVARLAALATCDISDVTRPSHLSALTAASRSPTARGAMPVRHEGRLAQAPPLTLHLPVV